MHDRLSPYQNWDKVAALMGESVATDRLLHLVEKLNQGGHIAHGIKRLGRLPLLRESGILPKTPEGGRVSFWASGCLIFSEKDYRRAFPDTFDTPFFNYSHTRDVPGHMLMVVTNPQLLDGLLEQGRIKPDSQVTIPQPIPRDRFLILHVIGGQTEEREQAMFELLEEAVEQGYAGGEERVRDLSA